MTQRRKTVLLGAFAVFLLAFLAANVAASQYMYAPVMFRLFGLSDRAAASEFLTNLEGSGLRLAEGENRTDIPGRSELDVFAMQSRYLNSHFDNIFAQEVDIQRLSVEKAIDYYEGLLRLNAENPQVLVKIGLLYKEKGDEARAEEYFEKARAVDPWVEVR
jgi:tetratricopeptide (TPR) repeat protein